MNCHNYGTCMCMCTNMYVPSCQHSELAIIALSSVHVHVCVVSNCNRSCIFQPAVTRTAVGVAVQETQLTMESE